MQVTTRDLVLMGLFAAVTAALGLLPMVAGINVDVLNHEVSINAPSMQWWQQLSTTVVSGLLFATVLTLAVTPAALMLKANMAAWWRRRGGHHPG